jgi:hypothetical protein
MKAYKVGKITAVPVITKTVKITDRRGCTEVRAVFVGGKGKAAHGYTSYAPWKEYTGMLWLEDRPYLRESLVSSALPVWQADLGLTAKFLVVGLYTFKGTSRDEYGSVYADLSEGERDRLVGVLPRGATFIRAYLTPSRVRYDGVTVLDEVEPERIKCPFCGEEGVYYFLLYSDAWKGCTCGAGAFLMDEDDLEDEEVATEFRRDEKAGTMKRVVLRQDELGMTWVVFTRKEVRL